MRLNADVWAHAASFLGDTSSLCALEVASRTHLKIAQDTSPSLAAATFVKGAASGRARSMPRVVPAVESRARALHRQIGLWTNTRRFASRPWMIAGRGTGAPGKRPA